MTRKDSEKDSERPHYYSQFWLDVAAGRRIIGAPRPEDEAAELESSEPAPSIRSRGGRGFVQDDSIDARSDSDGYAERIIHPVAEPLATPEEFIEPEAEEIDLETDNVNDLDIQDEVVDDTDIPDMDLGPAEVEEEDDLFDEEEEDEDEEEEEEDDGSWGARGRKRNKPVRPKIPPKKAPRREPRRGF
jgi:hypothetical protein